MSRALGTDRPVLYSPPEASWDELISLYLQTWEVPWGWKVLISLRDGRGLAPTW